MEGRQGKEHTFLGLQNEQVRADFFRCSRRGDAVFELGGEELV